MKFEVTKASDYFFTEKIEIHSLDDLEKLFDKYGWDLIINFKNKQIKIYDGYNE